MIINELNAKLLEPEYKFLRENENLGKNIILLTAGGSHAYGTNIETSDLDIRGIAIERKPQILGLEGQASSKKRFDHYEDKETDTVVYALQKFVSLALKCNPNVIEILGTEEKHIFHITVEGKLLRDNAHLFLSKRAINSFGGYAIAQLRRLENALARDEYPLLQKEKHILKTLQSQMGHFMDTYADLTGQEINLYLDKSEKEDYDTEIYMDLNLKHYPIRDFKAIYSEMGNIIKDYGELNHRNRKKDDNHLYKHAMHLIRLYITGIDIIEGKGIVTHRANERPILLDIRNGKYSFEDIFELATEYEQKFKYAIENTELPDKPNYKKIEELQISLYERRYSL